LKENLKRIALRFPFNILAALLEVLILNADGAYTCVSGALEITGCFIVFRYGLLVLSSSQASFVASGNRTDISLDDPNFWQKWAKIAELDTEAKSEKV
jgi:hypothetical protein